MKYLYNELENYYFMDMGNYEQISINKNLLGKDNIYYLKENMDVIFLIFNDEVIGIELPTTVILEVIEAEPGIKGDTASNLTKLIKLETGLVIRAPLFVNKGDKITVDTRNSNYISRV